MNFLYCPIVTAAKGLVDAIDSVRGGKGNPYLVGNYAPVTEEVEEHNCEVIEGELPADLAGVFVRNGPNPKFAPSGLYHWFDGDGMVHSMHIKDGSASYSNHQTQTQKLQQDISHGGPQVTGIGDMNGMLGLLKMGLNNLRVRLDGTLENVVDSAEGVANTAFVYHNKTLMAMVESSQPMQLTVSKEDGKVHSVGPNDYEGKLSHPFTAHPKVCPETGELMFFGYRLSKAPYISYSVVSKTGELVSTIDAGVTRPIMMHDFAITKSYSCFFDLPLLFKPMNMVMSKGVFDFDKNAPARIGVLPRHAKSKDEASWFDVKVCSVFHVANAYEVEENGEQVVIIRACRIGHIDMTDLTTDANIPYEWRLHMTSGLVEEGPIGVTSGDFPEINQNFLTQNNQYIYLAEKTDDKTPLFSGMVKIDAKAKKEVAKLVYGDEMYGGEMSFVPRQNPEAEDDGYLVGFVHKEKENHTEFWIVSAINFETICRVKLSARVPYGFHSLWIDAQDLENQRLENLPVNFSFPTYKTAMRYHSNRTPQMLSSALQMSRHMSSSETMPCSLGAQQIISSTTSLQTAGSPCKTSEVSVFSRPYSVSPVTQSDNPEATVSERKRLAFVILSQTVQEIYACRPSCLLSHESMTSASVA